jgi:hypothetical protein
MTAQPPRRFARFAIALATAGILLGSAAGCGNDFDPYNRLKTLRVLAVVADPPTPGPGETTNLTALVYTPEAGASESPTTGVTYSWSWCPFPGSANDGYPCQVTQEQLATLAAGTPLPPLELGAAPSVSFANAIDPAVLTQLCAGVPGTPQVLDCTGGFPIQIKVKITSPTDEVVTVTSLHLRFDPATTANQRPHIDGLTAEYPAASAAIVQTPQPIEPEAPGQPPSVVLLRNEEAVIKALMPATVVETYLGRDDDLNPAIVSEHLTLTWFVESGDTDDDRTSFVAGGIGTLEKTLKNKWKPALSKDYPATTARIVLVARDNRGGVGWRSGIVTLAPEPKL